MERHDLDLTSLIAGLLFIGLGTVFLTDLTGTINLHVRWVWPALLMGLGVALLASGPSRRNGAESSAAEPASERPDDAGGAVEGTPLPTGDG